MKIFFVIKGMENASGGAEKVISVIASGMAERGYDVTLITFDHLEAESFYDLSPKLTWHKIGLGGVEKKTGIKDLIFKGWELRKILNREKPDVAIGFMHSSFIPLSIFSVGTGVPIICSEHTVPEYYENRQIEFTLSKIAGFLSKRFSVISNPMAANYPRYIRDKIEVIANPIRLDPVNAHCSDRENIILSVGRIDKAKNHQSLIKAFALLKERNPSWQVHIYGRGPEEENLQALIYELNLEKHVHLKGLTKEVSTQYAKASIFAMPSLYESFGLVTAEASLAGLPVVGFRDCPGTNELVEHGKTGYLAEESPRDQSMARYLEVLMNDPSKRASFGEAAQHKMGQFSADVIIDKWITSIHGILAPKKEISYLISTTDVGGTEMHMLNITRELKARGWKPTIFCLSEPGPISEQLENSEIKIIHPNKTVFHNMNRKIDRLLQILNITTHFLLYNIKRKNRIIHFFLPASYLIGGLVTYFLSNKCLMSRRSLNNYQRKYPLFAWIERHLHKKMDIILGNSKAVVNQLLQDEQVAANKVGLIYNGIHPQIATRAHNRDQIRHALGFGPESVILVIVANLIPYKGHLDLIEALAMIKDQMVESWQLLCVGYDDGYGEKIISAAKTLEIDAYINVMGLRNDIPDILQAADISLLTSHEEGFSNAVLESMSAGLPMIVTDAGGNSEIVENETSGYVVPPHNPKELSKAILKLVHDPHKRQKMGNSGRNIIAEKFTIEKCVDDYEEIYNLLARKEDFTHWKNLKINLDDA